MMKKWGKALREKEVQIAIEQRKNPETVEFQGFFRGARYRTRTDKKVFWLVPFYAGKYHNVGELCNFIAISC